MKKLIVCLLFLFGCDSSTSVNQSQTATQTPPNQSCSPKPVLDCANQVVNFACGEDILFARPATVDELLNGCQSEG